MNFATQYKRDQVPLQMDLALNIRSIIDKKFLLTAVAESMYGLMLWMIYAVEGFLSLIAYGMNAIMTCDRGRV